MVLYDVAIVLKIRLQLQIHLNSFKFKQQFNSLMLRWVREVFANVFVDNNEAATPVDWYKPKNE